MTMRVVSAEKLDLLVENGSDKFWKSIQVYLQRPNILNNRIFGCQFLNVATLEEKCEHAIELYIDSLSTLCIETPVQLADVLLKQNFISLVNVLSNTDINEWFKCGETLLILRKLLPRMKPRFQEEYELVIVNQKSNFCTFYPLATEERGKRLTPDLCYKFSYNENNSSEIVLHASNLNKDQPFSMDQPSIEWLKVYVFPKIVKWTRLETDGGVSQPPLHLVDIEDYNNLRLNLRDKHAAHFVEIWPDDGTDPLKFVHEDIAIAAYLICLWEKERKWNKLLKKQSFVDLGCGNGLLVHILSSEGYPGIGVDLRKRQLWDLLGPETLLREMTITPSAHSLFPEYDWLIGNHSDELTPWIPVIATRSSFNMRVFLLPCCPFTFNGKYERRIGGVSQYQAYLTFIEKLCCEMGFNVERDKLRIPSTKRSCFVCQSRNYTEKEEKEVDERRNKFIWNNSKGATKMTNFDNNGNKPLTNSFVPRPKVEAVTNCTQLDKTFLESVVCLIANLLLSRGEGFHDVETTTTTKKLKYGGSIGLKELAEILDLEIKIKLKQQNGGLQTLIRNHRHIFEIKNGQIFITKPLINRSNSNVLPMTKNSKRPMKKPIAFQSRGCWFKKYHPDGCPLSDTECRYNHNISQTVTDNIQLEK